MVYKFEDADDDKSSKPGKTKKRGKKAPPFPLHKRAGGAKIQAAALRESMRGQKGGK